MRCTRRAETAASSVELLYWGPIARARAQLRWLWETPTRKSFGIVVGAGIAGSRAQYMTTSTNTGVRIEPSIDVGLSLRL